ncbi:MAG: hypothetical protein Q9175_006059 [Cornicularia normoerica]
MKLDRIPKHGWIQALVKAARGNLIILPGLVPKGCVADLVRIVEPTSIETFNLYDRLAVNIVSSKAGYSDILSRDQPEKVRGSTAKGNDVYGVENSTIQEASEFGDADAEKIQHTEPLPLFALNAAHRSKDASARYRAAYLEALGDRVRNELARKIIKRHAADMAEVIKSNPVFADESGSDVYRAELDLRRFQSETLSEAHARDRESKEELAVTYEKKIDECAPCNADDDDTVRSFLSFIHFLALIGRQRMRSSHYPSAWWSAFMLRPMYGALRWHRAKGYCD